MNTRRTLRKAIAGLLKQTVANPPSTSANHGNTEYAESTQDKDKK
jgi:hypothetical protein